MIFIHEPYKFDVIEQVTDFNGKRYYVTPKGDQYPSITTMLKILSDAGIKQWREKVGAKQADFISNAASSRGKELPGDNPVDVLSFAEQMEPLFGTSCGDRALQLHVVRVNPVSSEHVMKIVILTR